MASLAPVEMFFMVLFMVFFMMFFSYGSRVDEIQRAIRRRERHARCVAPVAEDGGEVDAVDLLVKIDVGGRSVALARRVHRKPGRHAADTCGAAVARCRNAHSTSLDRAVRPRAPERVERLIGPVELSIGDRIPHHRRPRLRVRHRRDRRQRHPARSVR